MKKIYIVSLLTIIPTLVFADGGANAVALFGAILLVLFVIGLASLVCAILYYKKERNWAFYLSGTLSAIIFAFGTLFMSSTPNNHDSIHYLIFIPPLILFAVLLFKKVKVSPTEFFWYFGLNVTLVMLLSNLLSLADNVAIYYLGYLNYGIYALCCFWYIKAMLKIENTEIRKLFFNANLICGLSFISLQIFYIITSTHLERVFTVLAMNISNSLIGLLIVLVVGNIATFLTIKNYR